MSDKQLNEALASFGIPDNSIGDGGDGGDAKPTSSSSSKSKKSRTRHKPKMENEKPVELGFVEDDDDNNDDGTNKESWRLTSPFFPSKLGGKPSWLDLKHLPDFNQLKCPSCDNQTKFLLQIYAPLDSAQTFHRTIFIFVCTRQACCVEKNSSKNLVVLRCQLQRSNEFYSDEPPSYTNPKLAEEVTPEKWDVKLCRICGCRSSAHCSKCRKINYCTKDHQTLDWKTGHKEECDDPDFKPEPIISSNQFNFKECEIVIDKEVLPKIKEKDKKEKIEEYKKLVKEGKAGTLGDGELSAKELLEAESYKSDKAFNKFRKRIVCNPDQVLRYDRCGEPLWVSSEKVPTKENIPNCSHCGESRTFEFQVMPQLLNYLGEESRSGSLDWGTFAVYTCENSCLEGSPYKTEFVWLQHFKDDSKGKDEDQN